MTASITPYTMLVLLMTGFIILLLSLSYFNPDGFNSIVGYKLALAVPVMGIGIWIMFNITNKLAAFAGLLALIVVVGMVYRLLPSASHVNNTAIIVNVVSIVAFIIVSVIMYHPNGTEDPSRLKYTWVMFGFIMVLMTLHSTGIVSFNNGSSVFVSLFVGSLLLLLIVLGRQASSTHVAWNACLWLLGLSIAGALIFLAISKLGSFQAMPDSSIYGSHWVWNAVWLLLVVVIVIRITNVSIPMAYLQYGMVIALLGAGGYGLYRLWKWMDTFPGAVSLTPAPVSTSQLTNVATYQQLTNSDSYQYKYAISFWVYLDSFPPETSKSMELLSYGGTPAVDYNATTNTLRINVKNETGGTSAIYTRPNIELQKWNHLLFNYNGGTLDVFYNGKLCRSAIEVVPYMKMDMLTIGQEDGANGHIGQLLYFKHPVDLQTVRVLYNKGVVAH